MLYKLKFIKAVPGLLFAIFLLACTNNQHYELQVNGNEAYLNMPPLKNLIIPQNMLIPLQNSEFDIPTVNQTGAIGKALSIRPPIQTFSLLNEAYTENTLTASCLFLTNPIENSAILWAQIKDVLQQKMIKIKQKNDSNYSLITDWIAWPQGDEDIAVQTREKIQLNLQNNQIVITVTNEGIKQGRENITNQAEIQHYNILMLNELIYSINKLHATKTNTRN